MKRTIAAAVFAFGVALAAGAEPPRLSNGRVETLAAAGRLEETVRKLAAQADAAPVWIGWAVATERAHEMCCTEWRGCLLYTSPSPRD